MRAAQRLAIDRDHSLDRLADPLHPLHKTRFKLLGINPGKDPAKRVVRRDAIRQLEPVPKKGFFRFPEFLDVHPSFCSTNDATDRQNDDIAQAMQLGALYAWVIYSRKNAF